MVLLRYYLWLAPQALLAILLAVLFYRRLHKQLQVFVAYVAVAEIANLAEDIVAFQHPFLPGLYAWTLLFGDGLGSVFKLAVIYVLANDLVFSRFRSLSGLRLIFGGLIAVLVLLSAGVGGALSGVSVRFAINIFHALDFALGLIQVGMLLTLFILTRTLQISWRNWATGVALGFGISACFELAGAALRNYFGSRSLIAVDIVESTGFHICVVIWLVYALFPKRPRPPGGGLEKSELESWNQELENILRNRCQLRSAMASVPDSQ